MKIIRQFLFKIIPFTFTFLLLGLSGVSQAFQAHGAPEGLYVHQMSHVLFGGGLAYLYWHTRRTAALTSKGWRYLRSYCVLLILWNILAFTGHAIETTLSPDDFMKSGSWGAVMLEPFTLSKIVFYIVKMDHLLCVPAAFFLLISLRTFYLEHKGEE
ncbi:MAG: hypothetical protein J7L69_05955 [Desulfobulbaceae bacterium]|nr:hypothetical protein [Desulfobulbaceae bacterium]